MSGREVIYPAVSRVLEQTNMGGAPSLSYEEFYPKQPALQGWPRVKRAFEHLMGSKGPPAKEVVQLPPEQWEQYCRDLTTPEGESGIDKELKQGTVFVVVPNGFRFIAEQDGGTMWINVFKSEGGWVGARTVDNVPGIHVFKLLPQTPPKPKIRVYGEPEPLK